MGCLESLPYEVLLARVSFKEAREFLARYPEKYDVEPGYRKIPGYLRTRCHPRRRDDHQGCGVGWSSLSRSCRMAQRRIAATSPRNVTLERSRLAVQR